MNRRATQTSIHAFLRLDTIYQAFYMSATSVIILLLLLVTSLHICLRPFRSSTLPSASHFKTALAPRA